MLLYHYSITYKDGGSLQNDYNRNYALAEPMLLALRKGADAFDNLLLTLTYLRRADGSWNQGKKSFLVRFEKDATEAIFEYIRETEFSDNSVSRLNCVYYFRDLPSAVKAVYADWIDCGDATKDQVRLLEIQVPDGTDREYDQTWYNCAYDCVGRRETEKAMAYARKYFSGAMSGTPIPETLCSSENHILREIKY